MCQGAPRACPLHTSLWFAHRERHSTQSRLLGDAAMPSAAGFSSLFRCRGLLRPIDTGRMRFSGDGSLDRLRPLLSPFSNGLGGLFSPFPNGLTGLFGYVAGLFRRIHHVLLELGSCVRRTDCEGQYDRRCRKSRFHIVLHTVKGARFAPVNQLVATSEQILALSRTAVTPSQPAVSAAVG